MSLEFVNIHGTPIGAAFLNAPAPKRKPKEQPESFHNGWRVQGIPPGALEEARAEHARATKAAQVNLTKPPKEWDEANWLMNAKRKAVRSKPYEVVGAARECAALAEKAGWLRVEIIELKKEGGKQ